MLYFITLLQPALFFLGYWLFLIRKGVDESVTYTFECDVRQMFVEASIASVERDAMSSASRFGSSNMLKSYKRPLLYLPLDGGMGESSMGPSDPALPMPSRRL